MGNSSMEKSRRCSIQKGDGNIADDDVPWARFPNTL